MPEMAVCDAGGELLGDAILKVWAYMSHPSNPDARSKMVAAYLYEADLEALTNGEPCEGFLIDQERVQFLIQMPELAKEESRELLKEPPASEGQIVGELLVALINVRESCRYLKATVEKVVEVFAQRYGKAVNGRGEQLQSAVTVFWRMWAEYKPVAHLWAAVHCRSSVEELPDSLEGNAGAIGFVADHTVEFLTLAELLREEAERLEILEPGEAWRLPASFQLADIDPLWPEIAPDLLEALEDRCERQWPGPNGEYEAEMDSETTYLQIKDAAGEGMPLLINGQFSIHCPGTIQAWMLYPKDELARNEFYDSWFFSVLSEALDLQDFVGQLLDGGGNERVAEFLRRVIQTPRFDEAASRAMPNLTKGLCAATILSYWLQLRINDPDSGPTPTAVINSYSKYLASLKKSGAPVAHSYGQHSLNDYWKEFRSVAHFYSAFAALYLHDREKPQEGRREEPEETSEDGEGGEQGIWPFDHLETIERDEVLKFFNLAEGIRHFVVDMNRKVGVEMVAVPESVGVTPTPVHYEVDLPEEFLGFYREYRPKHSAT